MPRIEINYQKSIIYKIEHLENPELLYVGSTTDFIKRKHTHKSRCTNENNNNYNTKLYQMISDNGGWIQFKIIVIKEYPCNSKIELLIEEDRQMKLLKSNMNSMKSYLTDEERIIKKKESDKEYYQLNKEYLIEQKKEYNQLNKEHIQEYKKEYQQLNKDHIQEKQKEYFQLNKEHLLEKQKEYNQLNKEHIQEKQKEYNQLNKEHRKEYLLKTFICDCGCEIKFSNKHNHIKSAKHINKLKLI